MRHSLRSMAAATNRAYVTALAGCGKDFRSLLPLSYLPLVRGRRLSKEAIFYVWRGTTKRNATVSAFFRTLRSAVVVVTLALNVLGGCDSPASKPAATEVPSPELLRLIHQSDGRELMVLSLSPAQEGLIETVKDVALPGVLEAMGQVTFDDRLVSTIISRVTGRIEELRKSQWDTVRRGEQVMSLYSPDFMTAEAEYLEATSGASPSGSAGANAGAFGLPARSFSLAANLKAAAVRKLELLGFSPADIAAIREPSASVWMRAPISGIIVSKNAVRGQQLNPGDQLFSLATLERVWITADLYEDDLARVKVGQSLQAVTAAYPGEVFKGTIQRISPSLDPNTHTLQLRCAVSNPGLRLKPQMLARVRIATAPGLTLVVPKSALVFDDNAYYAFVVVGANRFERRRVEIADWNEHGFARVLSGINSGERFLTTQSLRMNTLWHVAHGETS
jgi:Cu(I)/Ag(I) efflux system membrane fusion protein